MKRFIRFEDYSVPDLRRIFEKMCRDMEYTLTPLARANAFLLFAVAFHRRDERFGNARFVRNVYEKTVSMQADRLTNIGGQGQRSKADLVTIDSQDIPFEMMGGFDPRALDLTNSMWEARCPRCGKVTIGRSRFLGQRVTCKCGQKFVYPWWNVVVNTVPGLPAGLIAPSCDADKLGVVAETPANSQRTPAKIINKILAPERTERQVDHSDAALRPRLFREIIGQKAVVESLQTLVRDARALKEPIGHILFEGSPGMGKKTFATVLPNELGTCIQLTSGAALTRESDLVPFLTNASDGSILFIDEIHCMPPVVQEFITPAMDDFRLDIVLGEGPTSRTVIMRLKRFTLIGATTRSEMLSGLMRNRFKIQKHFDHFKVEELAQIVTINARKLNFDITVDVALELAARSRGCPGFANSWLRWLRLNAASQAGRITIQLARKALDMVEMNSVGNVIERGEPVRQAEPAAPVGRHTTIQSLAKSIPDSGVGPFAIKGHSKRWLIYHRATGLHAAFAHTKTMAKAATAALVQKGDWSFTDQGGFGDVARARLREVAKALHEGDTEALLKLYNDGVA
jgi:Holliday junction DNA helicase RuvB